MQGLELCLGPREPALRMWYLSIKCCALASPAPRCLPSLLLVPLGGTVFSLLVSVSFQWVTTVCPAWCRGVPCRGSESGICACVSHFVYQTTQHVLCMLMSRCCGGLLWLGHRYRLQKCELVAGLRSSPCPQVLCCNSELVNLLCKGPGRRC